MNKFNLAELKAKAKAKRYVYSVIGLDKKQFDNLAVDLTYKYPSPYHLASKLKMCSKWLVRQFLLHNNLKYSDVIIDIYEQKNKKEISEEEYIGLWLLIRHCEVVLSVIRPAMEASFSGFGFEDDNPMYG